MPFSSRFQNGNAVYYFMVDGSRYETALGIYGSGSGVSTITRPATVIANHLGTTTRVDFPGATTVICECPAERTVTLDAFTTSFAVNGYAKVPGVGVASGAEGSLIYQWGSASTVASAAGSLINFPIAYPTICYAVVLGNIFSGAAFTTGSVTHGTPTTTGFRAFGGNTATGVAAALSFHWWAIGG